ncbi:MAG: ABC transporter ATP-binding protein [Ruminococcaceae bacterium]|nr:ABC transporter ATP-binding protein [Oscillospiraceae bacterium]
MPPPFRGSDFEYKKIAPPKGIGDLPRYLRELLGGFFSRLIYIVKLVWETGPSIMIAMSLIALFQGVSPIISSYISRYLLNALQTGWNSGATLSDFFNLSISADSVFFLLIFMFVFKILNSVISQLNTAILRISGEKIVRCVKIKIMKKARELDISAFDRPAFYEKLENANREAGHRPLQILNSTFTVISTLIRLISYVVILTSAPGLWWASIVMVIVSIPSAIINFAYRRKNFFYMRWKSKERRQMNYYSDLMVNKDIAKEIRIFGLADSFIERFDQVFKVYYSGIKKLVVTENIWHVTIAIISAVINCAFFAAIAFMVLTGKIMLGDYSLYTDSLTSIAASVASLIGTSATIYEGTLFIDNLISFMDERQSVVPLDEKKPEKVKHGAPHTIEFCNVSFSYPGTDRPVIKNVNLKFGPEDTVVLVGLNGAGKTTLIKLLTRLYDPTEGVILLDGKDIRSYDIADVYKTFGIIFQDFGKYAFTVSENIAFGDIDRVLSQDDIKNAAEKADATDYINKLPAGFDTPLMRTFEHNGIELSIGQWQKLAIARAFYSNNDILILDEPTASLDAIAEQEIFNQFDELRQNKMTIFVSHRLSSATIASKIVVLEYGAVVEEGTHSELMEKKGRYYALFSTQAKRYIESAEK